MLGMTHLRQVLSPIFNEPGKSVVWSFTALFLMSPEKVNLVVFMFRESENIRRLQWDSFFVFFLLGLKKR